MISRPLFQTLVGISARRRRSEARRSASKSIRLEPLEARMMLAADIRSIDGTDNNLQHPDWGSTDVQLLRMAPSDYADGISAPAGSDRPSARAISNLLAAQSGEIINDRDLSAMVYAWGQFIDHDISLTTTADPVEMFPIPVPQGDPQFDPQGTGTQIIPVARSIYDPTTGASTGTPRQQLNTITAFIDGSQVYGSDPVRAAALRTFEGGHLKTSAGDLLSYNTEGLPNENELHAPDSTLFLAGDIRANENVNLTSIQTLFMREHNRWADELAAQHPDWSDEQLYQQARRMVVAEIQAITYNEFLPALLGHPLPAYQGYNPNVNPGIANEFSAAAYRLGHSLLGPDVEFLDNNGQPVADEIQLRDAFFNPGAIEENGIDPVLKYLASDRAQEVDTHLMDEVRNFLFGQPGQGGFDLAAINIQRGRDHGLADYNTARVAYGLPAVKSFAQITSDVQTQNALREAYGNVDNIDLWVGALAEDHIRGGSVGPLINRILTDQFMRLRDGDRFYYQHDLNTAQLRAVEGTTLADIIARNTNTTNLQDNVFFFHASISGRVVNDANASGTADRFERGLSGVTVQLLDLNGAVMATTVTGRNGHYSFGELQLGTYTVQVVAPDGANPTSSTSRTVEMTRGDEVTAIDFMMQSDETPTPTPPPRHIGGMGGGMNGGGGWGWLNFVFSQLGRSGGGRRR